jgi:uncharacterized membrane protein
MRYILFSYFISFLFFCPFLVQAQDTEVFETIESRAMVEQVLEEQLEPENQAYQVVEVRISSDNKYQNRLFTIDSRDGYISGLRYELSEEQEIEVAIVPGFDGQEPVVFVTDVVRLQSIMWLLILFITIVILVGLWRGITSLISLGVILAILFGFILPQLMKGSDPVLITLIGAAMILAVSIFATHGFRKTSLAAFVGTIGGLVVTGVLAYLFVGFTDLTGLASDQAAMLQLKTGMSLNAQGLLLAAIIIGALGVLDDVAVTQAETVQELIKTDSKLSGRKLFGRAMRIGRHHIGSVINTLVLAYAGASLPILILFVASDQSSLTLLNSDFIAEEVVRTLVGTIGLVCTVPLATWLAVLVLKRGK